MTANTLSETLNGGFNGLLGEVVTHDCYRLKQLNFTPGIFIDCGANIGVTSRYARSLFPDALIVSIEPDKENYHHLVKFTTIDLNMVLLNMAIGEGEMYRVSSAINGAHEVYANDVNGRHADKVNVECIMLDEIINTYVQDGMKSILKLDVEGNEEKVWEHEPSMQALKKIDYFTGEIHYTMLTGKAFEESKQKSLTALHSLDDTHNVVIEGTSFWCTKK